MKTHKFSEKQAEQILNAVDSFLMTFGNPHVFARHIEEMQYEFIEHAVGANEDSEGNETDEFLNISASRLGMVVFKNRILTDLIYNIEEAVYPLLEARLYTNIPGK